MGLTVALCFNLSKDLVTRGEEPPDLQCELDSEKTIRAISTSIERVGHAPVLIEADDDLPAKLMAEKPDIVFSVAEGLRGESRESYLPSVCDALGIPYTGSGVLATALSLDKSMAKRIWAFEGVPTAPFRVIHPDQSIDAAGLRYPLFVKPLREGSSMGISDGSRAADEAGLRRLVQHVHRGYKQPALVEEYLPGREFTVGILGNEDPEVFPVLEVNFDPAGTGQRVQSQRFKIECCGREFYTCPAEIDETWERLLKGIGLAAFRALGCRDWARVDVRCDAQGNPYVLELNAVPGISPGYSDYPRMAEVAGYNFGAMVNAILKVALERCGMLGRAAGAISAPR